MSEPLPEVATPAAGAPSATAGELLRAARDRQGVHLATLAASMKVPQRKLELLESNRYDELPNATFTRALALSMCRSLKIESEPVLARLPRAVTDELGQVSLGLNEPFRDRLASVDGVDWRRFVNLPTLAGLVLVLGAAAVYWLPMSFWPRVGGGSVTRVASSAPTAPTAITTGTSTTTLQAPTAAAPDPTLPTAAPGAVVASVGTTASAPSVVETVFSAPATPASGPVAGGMLMLRAAAESWVEVRDGAGRVLLSRSLAAGEAAGLDGALPLRVVVGNAEATQVSFRGQPVSLGSTRDNVARLELK